MPLPITNRDLLDYGDINTKLFDAREAATAEIQAKSSDSGEIPLQSISKQDWWLNIAVECVAEGCDNVLTPKGLKLLSEIDAIIENDPQWKNVCILDSPTNQTCANDASIGGKLAKISPLPLFKLAFGEDLSELTQFGIDFALYGLAREEDYFNYTIPLFSKDYNRFNRKAKMTRFLLLTGGPVEMDGTRYKNMGDRQFEQEYNVANW